MKVEVETVKEDKDLKLGDLIIFNTIDSIPYYYLVIDKNQFLGLSGADKFRIFNNVCLNYTKAASGSKVVLTVE